VAANVDVVFIVSSLNSEFNLRRLERYVALAWESGAQPVIVLNKSDLAENPEELRREAEAAAIGVRVILSSALRGDGISEIRELMLSAPDKTPCEENSSEKMPVAKPQRCWVLRASEKVRSSTPSSERSYWTPARSVKATIAGVTPPPRGT